MSNSWYLAYGGGKYFIFFKIPLRKDHQKQLIFRGQDQQNYTFNVLPLVVLLQPQDNSLQSHGPEHAKLLCPPLSPRVCSNSCPLTSLTILSSTTTNFLLQSVPASQSFPIRQLFTSRDGSVGTSASATVLPMNIQDDFL